MNILALDIATKTGWCTSTAYGTLDCKVKNGESQGMRVVRFKSKVRELIELEKIDMIAYERIGGRFKNDIIVVAKMVGVLEDLCIEYGVELTAYSAKEIKMFAIGKGVATKPQMIAAAEALGYQPEDDNAADAIHLYLLTKSDLKL